MPRNPLEGVHRALGAFLVERAGTPMAAHYGDVAAEHEMVRRAAGVFDLCSAGKLSVRGAERMRFLQAMLAEDLSGLAAGRGAYSLLFSRDGRIAGEMRILELEDEVLLLTPSIARAKVRKLLERHVAASDVTVTDDSEGLALISVQGPVAARVLGGAIGRPAPDLAPFASICAATGEFGQVIVIGSSRGGAGGFDVLVPADVAPGLFERLVAEARPVGGGPAGIETLDSLRVEAGLTSYGADIDETTLPTEIDAIGRGISMTKGCFLGREAIERLIADGRPARRLAGLLFEGMSPPVRGDRLFRNGAPVGAVTSAAYSPMLRRPVALALLSVEATPWGTVLTTVDDEPVLVGRLPFWKPPGAAPDPTD